MKGEKGRDANGKIRGKKYKRNEMKREKQLKGNENGKKCKGKRKKNVRGRGKQGERKGKEE